MSNLIVAKLDLHGAYQSFFAGTRKCASYQHFAYALQWIKFILYLFCTCRLMHVRNANCQYTEAGEIWCKAVEYVSLLKEHNVLVNKASLFSEYSTLLFAKSQYEDVSIYCCVNMLSMLKSISFNTLIFLFLPTFLILFGLGETYCLR
jgi:hypothetical protein